MAADSSTTAQSTPTSTPVQISSLSSFGGGGSSSKIVLLSGGGQAASFHPEVEAVKRREILARQPSYCKILNDLKEAESSGSEDSLDQNKTMKGEAVEIVEQQNPQIQTVLLNGQQYQIITPTIDAVSAISGNQFSSGGGGGGTVYLPSASSPIGGATSPVHQARKREIRLMKNREAARECRNKKKEYIKCLENRVAVLENQNKALIEELKSLKELYKSTN